MDAQVTHARQAQIQSALVKLIAPVLGVPGIKNPAFSVEMCAHQRFCTVTDIPPGLHSLE